MTLNVERVLHCGMHCEKSLGVEPEHKAKHMGIRVL
ncbi:hypothetical protein Mnod_3487 [Methylobacterium nodulans ORS 2060]|uniref:Uncharacterized protein n=1 Tax=Methylobacterium nodulans (strain LMG 21967 / CNCM I-2342 / ORS 2060) TaxID=460265 RepID=B8INN2_METNO|nr:hypothetical protein Mnod_3487 [Methylobacterium nodulans ORS 2060]